MKLNERKIVRDMLVGGIETESGLTYLRVDDISALTVAEVFDGVIVEPCIYIHMNNGTIFTYKGAIADIQKLGIPIHQLLDTIVEEEYDEEEN